VTVNEIRKTVVVNAPPSVVFNALTEAKELEQWMPQRAKMDARVGGKLEFTYHWAERGIDRVVTGEILELIPNRKISYSWHSQALEDTLKSRGSTQTSVVTWTLEGLPSGKTIVTLVHERFAGSTKDAESGWTHYTGQLVQFCRARFASTV